MSKAKQIYDTISANLSKDVTNHYSTSFSLGIYCLDVSIRFPIYKIYGFVRIADEIVDTFHDYDKKSLLDEFELDTYKSIDRGISTNPILNSFQEVVNQYKINRELIDSFLFSMRMDLEAKTYDKSSYDKYIYGSAEVVGLMCLYVFVDGNQSEYDRLAPGAKVLGSAFQKINFIRDINDDMQGLGRVYFPDVDLDAFDEKIKHKLLDEIDQEFDQALVAIRELPTVARFGVYVAYIYYRELSYQIRKKPASSLLIERASVSNFNKFWLIVKAYFMYYCGKI